jgi:hypothetical protein
VVSALGDDVGDLFGEEETHGAIVVLEGQLAVGRPETRELLEDLVETLLDVLR